MVSPSLASDAWLLLAVAVGWTAALVWVGYATATGSLSAWLETAGDAGRAVRYLGRFLASSLVGVMYLRRRLMFKAQALAGVDPPNAWPIALAAVGESIVPALLLAGIGVGIGRL